MNRKLNPGSVRLAVSVAVSGAVYWAVRVAVYRAVRVGHPHPNLDRFLTGIRQTKVGAT